MVFCTLPKVIFVVVSVPTLGSLGFPKETFMCADLSIYGHYTNLGTQS